MSLASSVETRRGRAGLNGNAPILAGTWTIDRPVGRLAYDCIKLVFVRDGSAVLFGDYGEQRVMVGDAVLLGQNTICGGKPDDRITVTTIDLDRDYLADQLFWQHAAVLSDRHEADELLDARYDEQARVLPLGENRSDDLLPWLDELVVLSTDVPHPERFYRMQSLLSAVFDVVTPLVMTDATRQSPIKHHNGPGPRPIAPIRAEARRAAEFLQASRSQRWTLPELAQEVHLSPAQLSRVFVEAYGKTPLAYLTMLRIEEFARLLRTTNDPIGVTAREVGWIDASYAARVFRQCIGITPRAYRAKSRQRARPMTD